MEKDNFRFTFFSPLTTILSAALIIRLTASILFVPPLWQDEKEYVTIANSINKSGTFSSEGLLTANRTPGYPLFLAGTFLLNEGSLFTVRCIQSILSTISCLLLFLIALMLFSERTALIASSLYAVLPDSLLYVSLMMSETVFIPFFLAAILIFLNIRKQPNIPRLCFLGLLIGIGTLLRQNTPVLIILFILLEIFETRSVINSIKRYGVVFIMMVIVISPWLIRNKIQFDRFAMASNGGVNFWIGHNEHASGSYQYDPQTNPLEKISKDFDRSDAGYAQGIDFALHHPFSEAKLFALKTIRMFEPDFALYTSIFYRPEWRTYSKAVNIYKEFNPWIFIGIHLMTGAVIIIALWTVCFSRIGQNSTLLFSILIVAGWMLSHIVFFSIARFRLPVIPVIIMIAAYGVELFRSRAYHVTRTRSILFVAVSLILCGSWTAMFIYIYGR